MGAEWVQGINHTHYIKCIIMMVKRGNNLPTVIFKPYYYQDIVDTIFF